MIVRIFSTGKSSGKSSGEGPVNYLLNDYDHTGALRSVKPEALGNPKTTIDIINSIDRDWKYVSGAIAFRNEEQPTQEQILKLIDRFKQTFFAGLNINQYNILFVLHRDKDNLEIHFVVPMVELTTGKQLNIHPPGTKNINFYKSFTSVINYEMGYAHVLQDNLKIALPSHKLKSPEFKDDQRKNILLEKEVKKAIVSGKIENRTQLCKFLDEELGVSIHRQGKDYISIRLPGDQKSRRLRGPMFEENANYRDMLAASRKAKVSVKLTDTEYQHQKKILTELTNERAAFNSSVYSNARPVRLGGPAPSYKSSSKPTPITTIMKEIPSMANNTDIKKIIEQALITMQTGKPDKKLAPKLPNIKQLQERKNEIREKAYPSVRKNPPVSNGAIVSLIDTIGQVKMSIQDAIADLANAREPKDIIIAEQRLRELLELERTLNIQLHEAKVAVGNQQTNSKLKI